MNFQRRGQAGITLIELLIAVAVVAILAAVAYPAYTDSLVKNRRAAAQVVLSDLAQRQQQFLMDNRAYAGTPGSCVAIPADLKVIVPADVSSFYNICITVGTTAAPSYTATATPVAGTKQVSDGALTISSDGTRTPPGKW